MTPSIFGFSGSWVSGRRRRALGIRRGEGFRHGVGVFGGLGFGLQGSGYEDDGFAATGRDDNGGFEVAGAHPGMAGAGDAVATGDGNGGEEFAIEVASKLVHGFFRAHGHDVVLRADHIDSRFSRAHEFHPRRNALVGALFGPFSF